MTTWQVERFVLTHQTEAIAVQCDGAAFRGIAAGVRFDPRQHRQCLRLLETSGFHNIPVDSIRSLLSD